MIISSLEQKEEEPEFHGQAWFAHRSLIPDQPSIKASLNKDMKLVLCSIPGSAILPLLARCTDPVLYSDFMVSSFNVSSDLHILSGKVF